jgi:hypothetical protein
MKHEMCTYIAIEQVFLYDSEMVTIGKCPYAYVHRMSHNPQTSNDKKKR